ncbi:5'/3'-nucleotidase SurE [Streptomyces pinistramenti]|uniref:5'/3'-nucleotidase SurE n=1 Tax=Streptomyces pinistramenti TaxID=2884812 RepID=UPI001D063739|nr:5'/3'-nucleotidase SurE [Streptomyces pinistramenti]MCB5906166.1 5'/3'-nucleotidase SurE [Streptomyces pinistramenti]
MTACARVLVTNDDGVAAPGLLRLAAHVRDLGHQVVVAAPEGDESGCGTSRAVAPDGLVPTRSTTLEGLAGVPVHTVCAPPGLIVTAACQGTFGPAPDLVLAGINPGANVGPAVLHSGTVGAALTAAHHQRPAIAVSLGHGAPYHWDTALRALAVLLPGVLPVVPGHPPLLLNLNVPNVPLSRFVGVLRTGLGPYGDTRFTIQRCGPGLLRASHQEQQERRGGEAALLAAGYATVTPLRPPTEDTDAPLDLPAVDQAPAALVGGPQ